eukprot:7276829-Prymnesium_polylepis.1
MERNDHGTGKSWLPGVIVNAVASDITTPTSQAVMIATIPPSLRAGLSVSAKLAEDARTSRVRSKRIAPTISCQKRDGTEAGRGDKGHERGSHQPSCRAPVALSGAAAAMRHDLVAIREGDQRRKYQ